jgi:hypothetical protein
MTATFATTTSPLSPIDLSPYWSDMLVYYEKGMHVPFSMVEKLYHFVNASSLDTLSDFHKFLRNFLALLLIKDFSQDNSCDEIFYFMQKKAILNGNGLYQAYYPLLALLLNKTHSASYLFLKQQAEDSYLIPSYNAEQGVLFFLEGVIKKEQVLIEKGLALAVSQLDYFDESEDLFKGALAPESEADQLQLYAIYSLLFSLASFFLPEQKKIASVYRHLSSFLEKKEPIASEKTFLYSLLHVFFRRTLSNSHELTEKKFSMPSFLNSSKSKVTYNSKTTSILCTAEGNNLGFACMKKHQVEFLSIGPQQGNVGDMALFGIHSCCQTFTDQELIRIESSEKGFYFNAWLKCVDPCEEALSKNWLHVLAVSEMENLDLTVKSLNLLEEQELSLLFFVRANKVIVDQTFHLSPHTLDRYEGKVASLTFYTNLQPVVLESSLHSTMKVIPLSGEHHFWGAEFLIAYALTQEESISFKIH